METINKLLNYYSHFFILEWDTSFPVTLSDLTGWAYVGLHGHKFGGHPKYAPTFWPSQFRHSNHQVKMRVLGSAKLRKRGTREPAHNEITRVRWPRTRDKVKRTNVAQWPNEVMGTFSRVNQVPESKEWVPIYQNFVTPDTFADTVSMCQQNWLAITARCCVTRCSL